VVQPIVVQGVNKRIESSYEFPEMTHPFGIAKRGAAGN
jgi:hypothetical protein